jgi:hypothetical protein
MRALALAVSSPVLARALYRLCLGVWPNAAEARQFAAGLRDRTTKLPPCCRAMLTVPAAQVLLGRVLLTDMVRRGTLGPASSFESNGASQAQSIVPELSGNPLAFWHGPPIAFLHMEKTAGISLAKLLTDRFHPAQIDPDPHRTLPPHLFTPFAGRPAAAIRRHALLYGHYDLPSLRQLDAGRIIVTMLRDPVARILSLYYYWRSIDLSALRGSVSFPAVAMAHRCGLLEFLSADAPVLRDHIDNIYVRRLTGLYSADARSDRVTDAPNLALSAALKGLRKIDFVGVTEAMAPSVAALGAFLGFTPPAAIPRVNMAVTNAAAGGVFRTVEREALTPAHWRHLARLTRLDAVVYRAACDRFTQFGGAISADYAPGCTSIVRWDSDGKPASRAR